jgi:hypothetical protein
VRCEGHNIRLYTLNSHAADSQSGRMIGVTSNGGCRAGKFPWNRHPTLTGVYASKSTTEWYLGLFRVARGRLHEI